MLEQILRHRVCLLGQVEVLVARAMVGDGGGDFAAAQDEEHRVLGDGVADVHGQVVHLSGHRRQDSRHPVGVELDHAGRL